MERVVRQTVTAGPGGRIELPFSEVAPGATAELTLVFSDHSLGLGRGSVGAEATEGFEKFWAMSDRLTENGMETWSIDRINAEIAERRGGDREGF